MGVFSGSARSADQSELALFWAGNTPLDWNRTASQIDSERSLSLSENAHLFALLNVAMAEAGIACWNSKYRYVFWRPITAIRAGDTDATQAPIRTRPGRPGSTSSRVAPRLILSIHPAIRR
jgi:hypothetical protein